MEWGRKGKKWRRERSEKGLGRKREEERKCKEANIK